MAVEFHAGSSEPRRKTCVRHYDCRSLDTDHLAAWKDRCTRLRSGFIPCTVRLQTAPIAKHVSPLSVGVGHGIVHVSWRHNRGNASAAAAPSLPEQFCALVCDFYLKMFSDSAYESTNKICLSFRIPASFIKY